MAADHPGLRDGRLAHARATRAAPYASPRAAAGGHHPSRKRTLNAPANPDDDPRPVPPEPPLPSDCCESGCDPCVYDLYADQLQHYRERLARWRERHPDAD